jgi:hypothetical protein
MCDAFLTLAKVSPDASSAATVAADPKVAPSCFLVPRWKPNGERNTGFQVTTVFVCEHCSNSIAGDMPAALYFPSFEHEKLVVEARFTQIVAVCRCGLFLSGVLCYYTLCMNHTAADVLT